ncbi:MAG: hypothetical protein ACRDCW_03000 [Sarcina sp.]
MKKILSFIPFIIIVIIMFLVNYEVMKFYETAGLNPAPIAVSFIFTFLGGYCASHLDKTLLKKK